MKMAKLMTLLTLAILLVACSMQEEQKQLTRVDVQKINQDGNYEAEITISDDKKIELIRSALEKVKWEQNIKAEMSRPEDVFATLFYTIDKNMPERLYQHRLWFNGNGTTTIVSNNEEEGHGTLDQEHSQILQEVLFQ